MVEKESKGKLKDSKKKKPEVKAFTHAEFSEKDFGEKKEEE